ncbi:hypothetical protein IV203_030561 [Nitzschia inconspicua]|uniref:Uncharacterized protein n=1 Tax=Nitzschia inconspicua TaxID=303405 RepID=A0A9K3PBP5_9STRA|nr:hypothetical protein IV203_022897 [Nitzschia inconspicua]KAG7367818.1 hypothetical protein IV203_030561 [Nitzschia inconspicua]
MASRVTAVTVSTITDDEDASSYTTDSSNQNEGLEEEEDVIVMRKETEENESKETFEDTFEDEIVPTTSAPFMSMYNNSNNNSIPLTTSSTVMAVVMEDSEDPFDPLQQHKNLGGAALTLEEEDEDDIANNNNNSSSSGNHDTTTYLESFQDEIPMDTTLQQQGRNGYGTPALAMMVTTMGTAIDSLKSYRKERSVQDNHDDPFAVLDNIEESNNNNNNHDNQDDTFDDEIVSTITDGTHQSSSNNDNNNKKKKKTKNGTKKKNKDVKTKTEKKKKNKKKKDPKITAITYEDPDEDDQDMSLVDSVDCFQDEDDDHGSHVHTKATSTRAPPTGSDHDLEAAVGAETSLAVPFSDTNAGMMNHDDRFVLDDDEIQDYKTYGDDAENSRYSDGVFLAKSKRPSNDSPLTSVRTLRESIRNAMSAISPLHARPKATPNQEAWQDKDGFHDELITFDDKGQRDPSITGGEESWDSDEEESLFAKAISSRHTNYRRNLLFGKQSWSCWCLVILAVTVFLAMLIPLAILSQEKRQATKAQNQAATELSATTGTNEPSETTQPCVDEIVLNHNHTCFNTSTAISFSFTMCNPDVLDWIGLYPANSVFYDRLWRDYINWIWACGNEPCTNAQVSQNLPLTGTFLAPARDPGSYQFFIVLDSRWPYRYVASSDVFTVSETCDND